MMQSIAPAAIPRISATVFLKTVEVGLNTVFTVPPSSVRNIGDALLKKEVSFAYFGDQFNAYLANPYNNYVTPDNTYCNICNFFQYFTSIMTNEKVRAATLQDTLDLYADLASGNLP